MPYTLSFDTRVHYQIAGSGPPVVLYHGFGGSSADWADFGLVDALAGQFSLIMLDARGHGCSGKPHASSDYTLERKVFDVLAVLDHLEIERAHFYGYSYGGLMGWMLGSRAPQRFASMALGGSHPYMPEGPEMFGRFNAMLRYLDEGMDVYVQWREAHGVTWPAAFRARMLANDAVALKAFIQSTPDHFPLSFSRGMVMPVLVFSGDDDELMAGSKAQRAAAELPDGRYLEIADADHPTLYLDSARAAPHVAAFFHDHTPLLLPAAR